MVGENFNGVINEMTSLITNQSKQTVELNEEELVLEFCDDHTLHQNMANTITSMNGFIVINTIHGYMTM